MEPVRYRCGELYLPLLLFAEFTTTVDWPALLAVLYLGAVVSVLAYLFDNHALGLLLASQVTVYVSPIPALGAFSGWLLLGEMLNLTQGAAILLTVAGVVYSQTGSRVAELEPATQPVES